MTDTQIKEGDKIFPLLTEAREHLDNVMYRMGDIDEEDYLRLRKIYNLICLVQDVAVNRDSYVNIEYDEDDINVEIQIR